jgi:hypothetical protein
MFVLLGFFLTATNYSQARAFEITGSIKSADNKEVLEAATVHIERLKNSSIVAYTITNSKRNLEVPTSSSVAKIKLIVSLMGFQPHSKTIEVKTPNTGTFFSKSSNTLGATAIRSSAAVTIKKNALEFNVKSFKTKAAYNVEDLLKKLPGVKVDPQDEITLKGKNVNKIIDNEKLFLGNDPTSTTRNLTKDIIEKIQITDTKTNPQAFSGEDFDSKIKQ